MKQIVFYRVNEPYGEFSNFSPHPFELKGKSWPTSEHDFQAQKFAGTEHEESVRQAKSPMVAAAWGEAGHVRCARIGRRSRMTSCGKPCGRSLRSIRR